MSGASPTASRLYCEQGAHRLSTWLDFKSCTTTTVSHVSITSIEISDQHLLRPVSLGSDSMRYPSPLFIIFIILVIFVIFVFLCTLRRFRCLRRLSQ
jgi:hypothetical protein